MHSKFDCAGYSQQNPGYPPQEGYNPGYPPPYGNPPGYYSVVLEAFILNRTCM